jgi:hypothetical protein
MDKAAASCRIPNLQPMEEYMKTMEDAYHKKLK